jgi:hypothetical protein
MSKPHPKPHFGWRRWGTHRSRAGPQHAGDGGSLLVEPNGRVVPLRNTTLRTALATIVAGGRAYKGRAGYVIAR